MDWWRYPNRYLRHDHGLSDTYWNHNTAYHRWILKQVTTGQRVLDIGCGDGLLLARLKERGCIGVGLEPDKSAAQQARLRQVTVLEVALQDFQPSECFDVVIMVASLHHMPLEETLIRIRDLLPLGGKLLVVGLAANRSIKDWVISALQFPLVKIGSKLHHETPNIGVLVTSPQQTLTEIRSTATSVLPGVQIRRGLYYRYLLQWTKTFSAGGCG